MTGRAVVNSTVNKGCFMSKNQTKILTPTFRVSFPSVFEPQDFNGKLTYSVTMLFDKSADLSALKAAVKAAAEEKWGKKVPAGIRNPIRDGAEKAHLDGYDGCMFIRASSKTKPGLVDQNCQEIINPSEFYAGCIARATVVAFAYDQAGNKGVSFLLSNIQKVADGESFSSRGRAADDFAPVGATSSDEDIFG